MKKEELLQLVVQAIDDRKGLDIVALDVDGLTPLADYFVVTHATNNSQQDAIVNHLIDVCHEHEIPVKGVEGRMGHRWTLVDLVDVIVHVFQEEERGEYNLESMWQDAPLVAIDQWLDS